MNREDYVQIKIQTPMPLSSQYSHRSANVETRGRVFFPAGEMFHTPSRCHTHLPYEMAGGSNDRPWQVTRHRTGSSCKQHQREARCKDDTFPSDVPLPCAWCRLVVVGSDHVNTYSFTIYHLPHTVYPFTTY